MMIGAEAAAAAVPLVQWARQYRAESRESFRHWKLDFSEARPSARRLGAKRWRTSSN